VIEDSRDLYGQQWYIFLRYLVSWVRVQACLEGSLKVSILHYTQSIIREATVALLEDMTGHLISDLPGRGSAGVNECSGTLNCTSSGVVMVEE
jgi:hypothetical protein